MKWYFPSWNGDFRLADGGNDRTLLIVEDATPAEIVTLGRFRTIAIKKKWIERDDELNQTERPIADGTYVVRAPIDAVGRVLLKVLRPHAAALTAVRYVDGRIETVYNSDSRAIERIVSAAAKESKALAAKAAAETAPADDSIASMPSTAAVSVSRPTPSCPSCIPGAVTRASEVLLSFLSAEQHEQWAKHRAIIAVGQLTGHRYRIAHRHTPLAVRQTRICWDTDDDLLMHFHDWSVPPEEEVLAAKLILEHAEPWLRNEATAFGTRTLFKNPFGGYTDGGADAGLTQAIGDLAGGVLSALGVRDA